MRKVMCFRVSSVNLSLEIITEQVMDSYLNSLYFEWNLSQIYYKIVSLLWSKRNFAEQFYSVWRNCEIFSQKISFDQRNTISLWFCHRNVWNFEGGNFLAHSMATWGQKWFDMIFDRMIYLMLFSASLQKIANWCSLVSTSLRYQTTFWTMSHWGVWAGNFVFS